MNPGNLSYGIAVAALAAATTVQGVLLLQTLAAIVRRRVSAPAAPPPSHARRAAAWSRHKPARSTRAAALASAKRPAAQQPHAPTNPHLQGVFTPEYKWGPLSFMRLTHEAFRAAIPRLVKAAEAAAQGAPATHPPTCCMPCDPVTRRPHPRPPQPAVAQPA
jgi:hypothetical protein